MNELYRTYEVLIEETVHPNHPKRNATSKPSAWGDGSKYEALRDTNSVFQDAVCYYTILLAGLAGHATENGKLLNPLWAELCKRAQSTSGDVTRVLHRLARNYPKLPSVGTFEDFVKSVLAHGKGDTERIQSYRILEAQLLNENSELEIEKLNVFAHDNGLRLCSTTSQRKMPGSAPLDRLYWQLHSKESCHNDVAAMVKEIAEFVDSAGVESDRVKAHYKTAFTVGKKLKTEETIWAKSKKAKKLLPIIEGKLPSIESEIEKATEDDKRFVWLHKTGPINPMAWLLARFLWLQKDGSLAKVALEDLVTFIKKPGKKIPKPVGGDLQSMPSKFNYFTHWLGINFESPAFREKFDDAALSMAFEDVFKYKLRTQKREEQRVALSKILAAYEGDGGTIEADDSPTGKDLLIRGMKGDPRWKGDKSAGKKGIVDLLADLAREKGFDDYGLRSGTIGGWTDLKKRFLRLERFAKRKKRKDSRLQTLLELAVDHEQMENRQGFGSADVFKKLCQPQYHDLWSASAWSNDVEDFIPHFTRYSEWVEESGAICELDDQGEIVRDANGDPKPKPISYTFPGEKNRHDKTSYRHFDFKESLNSVMELNLFRQKQSSGNGVSYELVREKITLSARRLKRDKVMTVEGTSIGAVWCPPLALNEDKPRAGKKKQGQWQPGNLNASFSLMVEDEILGELPPPVHMTVSIPLTSQELDRTLRAEKVNWGKSWKWDKDGGEFYGKFFRWKIDLLTRAKESLNRLLKEKILPQHLEELRNVGDELSTGNASLSELTAIVQRVGEVACGNDAAGKKRAKKFKQAADTIKECNESVWHTKRAIDFNILSVDLGTRFSSAFARLRIHCEPDGKGRLISPDDFTPPIRAHMYRKGTLRLQGENAQVWDHSRDKAGNCVKNAAGQYIYEKQAELYGNDGRGRYTFHSSKECAACPSGGWNKF